VSACRYGMQTPRNNFPKFSTVACRSPQTFLSRCDPINAYVLRAAFQETYNLWVKFFFLNWLYTGYYKCIRRILFRKVIKTIRERHETVDAISRGKIFTSYQYRLFPREHHSQ